MGSSTQPGKMPGGFRRLPTRAMGINRKSMQSECFHRSGLNRMPMVSGALAAILVLALLIRAGIFFHGIRGSDAYAYAWHAHALATGQYRVSEVGDAFYGYRYGLLLPLAATYALFGVNDLTSAAIPLGLALATIALTYSLGVNLSGPRLGLISALIMATYPASIIGASLVGPDSFLPFYVGIGVWLLLLNPGDVGGWIHLRGPLVAGLFLGVAVLTR